MISVLAAFASASVATIADGSRTEPRVQANSTILTCAAEKRQTEAELIHELAKRTRMCETVFMEIRTHQSARKESHRKTNSVAIWRRVLPFRFRILAIQIMLRARFRSMSGRSKSPEANRFAFLSINHPPK